MGAFSHFLKVPISPNNRKQEKKAEHNVYISGRFYLVARPPVLYLTYNTYLHWKDKAN